ncbi:MAG: hypothetical protein KDA99_21880, partial [Planctomycetales bacterium]|nr:hypothetical protein [Planctomycetales bacterium]
MPFDQENTGPTRQAVFAVPAGAVVATCVLLFFAPATSAQEPSPSAQWQSVLEHIETVTPDRISPLQTEALQSVEDMSVRVDEAPTKLQPLLRTILIKNIPDEYEDLKRWGKTKRVFSGIHVQLDGGKLRTHRNRKDVNHGTWKKYQLQLVDPEEH